MFDIDDRASHQPGPPLSSASVAYGSSSPTDAVEHERLACSLAEHRVARLMVEEPN